MDVFLRRAVARCPSSAGMGLRCCMGDWQPLGSHGKGLRFFLPAPGAAQSPCCPRLARGSAPCSGCFAQALSVCLPGPFPRLVPGTAAPWAGLPGRQQDGHTDMGTAGAEQSSALCPEPLSPIGCASASLGACQHPGNTQPGQHPAEDAIRLHRLPRTGQNLHYPHLVPAVSCHLSPYTSAPTEIPAFHSPLLESTAGHWDAGGWGIPSDPLSAGKGCPFSATQLQVARGTVGLCRTAGLGAGMWALQVLCTLTAGWRAIGPML